MSTSFDFSTKHYCHILDPSQFGFVASCMNSTPVSNPVHALHFLFVKKKKKNLACHAFFGSNFLTFFFLQMQSMPFFFGSNLDSFVSFGTGCFDLRMGRDDEPVDSMEIDSLKQQQLEALTAVPEGFSADYLRIYYGKLIRSLIMVWSGEDKLKQDRHLLSCP